MGFSVKENKVKKPARRRRFLILENNMNCETLIWEETRDQQWDVLSK